MKLNAKLCGSLREKDMVQKKRDNFWQNTYMNIYVIARISRSISLLYWAKQMMGKRHKVNYPRRKQIVGLALALPQTMPTVSPDIK